MDTVTCTTCAQHRTLQERAIFFHHQGHLARCMRYASVGLLSPFWILLGTTPGKLLGSFGNQLKPQNTINIARNVLWTFPPSFHGTLGRNFGGICGTRTYWNFSWMLGACFACNVVHEQRCCRGCAHQKATVVLVCPHKMPPKRPFSLLGTQHQRANRLDDLEAVVAGSLCE